MYTTKESYTMKRLSVFFAIFTVFSALWFAGCSDTAKTTEAFIVSIYSIKKEQDNDGIVYIKNNDLWKTYTVAPTHAIELPEFDPEKEDKESRVAYNSGIYNDNPNSIDGLMGNKLACKNKLQFIPSANCTLFVRERQKKTLNLFYEGKNVQDSFSGEELEEYKNKYENTYAESFSFDLSAFLDETKGNCATVSLYTKENSETAFATKTRYYNNDGGWSDNLNYHFYNEDSHTYVRFNLIKDTNIYIKVEYSNIFI